MTTATMPWPSHSLTISHQSPPSPPPSSAEYTVIKYEHVRRAVQLMSRDSACVEVHHYPQRWQEECLPLFAAAGCPVVDLEAFLAILENTYTDPTECTTVREEARRLHDRLCGTTNTAGRARPFVCPLCEKSYSSGRHLRRHEQTHSAYVAIPLLEPERHGCDDDDDDEMPSLSLSSE
jgi:hypothetical protein